MRKLVSASGNAVTLDDLLAHFYKARPADLAVGRRRPGLGMTTQVTVVSTKGGVGKTALTANLGGILAIWASGPPRHKDVQPTLSSYYRLTNRVPRVCESGSEPASLSPLPIGLADAALICRPFLRGAACE